MKDILALNENIYLILVGFIVATFIMFKMIIKMVKFISRVFVVFAIVSFISITSYTFSPNVRDKFITTTYKIFPTYIRDSYVYKLTNDDLNITLLGTFGDKHIDTSDYSLHHLQSFVKNSESDLIVLQTSTKSIDDGDISEGRVDMPYIYLTSEYYNIDCIGMNINKGNNEKIDKEELSKEIINIISYYDDKEEILVFLDYKEVKYQVEALITHNFKKAEIDKGKQFNTNKVEFYIPGEYMNALETWVSECTNNSLNIDIQDLTFSSCTDTEKIKKRVSAINKITSLLKSKVT